MYILLQSDATLFFGRFHSLSVHLPIGFLLLGAILFLLSFSKKFSFLIKALPLTLLLGAISAIASVILGLFLAEEGGYPEDYLFWHRLMGIAVSILSIGSILLILGYFDKDFKGVAFQYRIKIDRIESAIIHQKKALGLILGCIVICVSITGHLGGNLTHGENYLYAYAPESIQALLVDTNLEKNSLPFPEDSDSTLIFDHIIGPVLIQKCASCHGDDIQKGGLKVTSLDELLVGGETGPAFEEGAPHSSELFKRVTMDPESRKFMPPKGAGLSYGEITLLSYWIEKGMSQNLSITNEDMPEEIQELLESNYGLSTKRKAHYEKIQVSKAPDEALEEIRNQGFRVSGLSEESNFLEIAAIGELTKENLESLRVINEQITWLDLGGANIDDSWLEIIADFPNLTRLLLDNNPISDQGINSLANLKNLESINLYNTSVGDSTLNMLIGIKSLRSMYLWNTRVSKDLLDRLNEENPKLKIDGGVMGEKKEDS